MLRWAPPKVLQPPFGRIDSSVHNGDFLALDPDHEREIIAAFRETGFRCRKDNDLILRATGHSRPKLKKRSVAELLRALASSNWSVVSGARRALASRGSSVVPKSLAALKDKNEKVRSGAATVLGDIRPIPEAVISALIEALNDDSEDVFQAVCYRLPALRDKAGSVTPLLIERWKHGTYMVRDAAGWALGRVGGDPSVVVPALIEGMQDSCVSLRAAYSLGQIGVPAVPFLVKAHRQRQIDISNLAPVFAQMARSNNDADVRGRAAEILKLLRQEGILGSFERGVP